MVKIAVFSCRKDEQIYFERYGKEYGVELVQTRQPPELSNAELVKGCQAVSIITTPVDAGLLKRWKEYGIKVISTRTIGFEHIDYQSAARLGITVSNVSYSEDTVAEYTVMMILMALRKMKTILARYSVRDYSLRQVRGRELSRLTVGVAGTGKIGETVIRNLSGFGCKILACDVLQKECVKQYAKYVTMEQLFQDSDVITLHIPAAKNTYHMVNEQTLRQMKDGVVIVNTSRGSLIDTPALIRALESSKVGAAALDVVEEEAALYYKDLKYQLSGYHEIAVLQSMPNVLMTPHTAFFTDEAVGNMIEYSIASCIKTLSGEENPWKVN